MPADTPSTADTAPSGPPSGRWTRTVAVVVLAALVAGSIFAASAGYDGGDQPERTTVSGVTGNTTVTVSYTTPANGTQRVTVADVDPALSDAQSGWAIVRQSTLPAAVVDAAGTSGSGIVTVGPWALVGEMSTATTTVGNATLRVVAPNGSRTDPARKAGFLARFLSPYAFGPALDRPITILAAPRTLPSRGLMHSDRSGYVTQHAFWDGEVDSVWIHEYIHGRENVTLAPEMRWFDEAAAKYLTYRVLEEQYDPVTEADIRTEFATNPTFPDVQLSNASAVAATRADYHRGARLLYAVDARIRAGSDGEHTFVDVFRTMNARDGAISAAKFVRIVERHSGQEERWIHAAMTQRGNLSTLVEPAGEGVFDD
ncbi:MULTISPECIES: hypothetical protein [Salinibaculum]|uniref:hypothetical protein n=1 Tax=Salinibaculum TaxID=2732368 RepID=UPI0030CF667B